MAERANRADELSLRNLMGRLVLMMAVLEDDGTRWRCWDSGRLIVRQFGHTTGRWRVRPMIPVAIRRENAKLGREKTHSGMLVGRHGHF